MRIAFTSRCPDKDSHIRDCFYEKAEKIEQYLKRFKDELVHMHGAIEENPHKEEFFATISLYLPTGVLYCRKSDDDYAGAINEAFLDLVRQLKKHKDKLNREKRRMRKHPIKSRFR